MTQQPLDVLYNKSCPICRAEIAHYRRYAEKHALDLRFQDLAETDLALWNVDAESATKRLHVRQGEQILSGISAFIALWRAMPRYAWLGRFASKPMVRPIADLLYNRVLAPTLYRMHQRRQRNSVSR